MIERRTMLKSALAAAALGALPRGAFAQDSGQQKLFDCHGHFYSNDWRTFPFNARSARYGPERMVAKAMENPMTPEAVFAFWFEAGVEKGLGVQYSSTYFTNNDYLLHIASEHPDKIIPIVILDAVDPETPDTIETWARERNIAGNRFIGAAVDGEFPYLSDAALPVWERAHDLGLTVTLLPLGGDKAATMNRVGELAARYPNLRVVLDHMGQPNFGATPDTYGYTPEMLALAEQPNVYYKHTTFLLEILGRAGAPFDEFLEYSVEKFGADHMIWGSDIGNSEVDEVEYVNMFRQSAAGLSPEQRSAIFWDTAEGLFVPGGRGGA